MATVRTPPVIALIVHTAVLVILARTVGLGGNGWAVGAADAIVTSVALARSLRRKGGAQFGPASWVTLTRGALVGGVAALTADSLRRPVTVAVLVGIATVALGLDLVDGQVARRTHTTSALGARFDMEVDAFLILVLSVYVAGPVGAWVLAIGGMRYAYVAAGWVLPWLRGSLPARYWRKVVAATVGIVVTVASSGLLPTALVAAALAASLALLVESFGRDVVWLWRRRVRAPGVV